MRLAVPPAVRALAEFWSEVLTLGAAAALAGLLAAHTAPPQDLPWTPLRLVDPPGLFTGFKFDRAAADPDRCRAVLAAGGITFAEAPDRHDRRCSIENALRLEDGAVPLAPASPVMTCQQALAYAFWTRHVVQPAAREHLASPVARIEHYGTYACRSVRGRDQLSQHGRANALDVAGFHLADGRRITIARDFYADNPRGRFLRQSRDGACRWFKVTLGPDYNPAHRDHLHLDRASWGICR